MIVSKKHRFLFIHNPKCAGQSVRQTLQPYHDSEITYWDHEFSPLLARVVDKAHLWAKDIELFEELDLNRFFVFGFVRNPYARFVSAFKQFILMNPEFNSMELNEFTDEFINPLSIRYDWNLIHFCPQHLFFWRGNKMVADYIGTLENFSENLIFISSFLGLDISEQRINASGSTEDSVSRMSPETIKMVNSLYERDFLLFNYPMSKPIDEVGVNTFTYRSRVEGIVPNLANLHRNLRDRNDSLKADLESIIGELDGVKQKLNSLLSSRSWRLTKPFREIMRITKRN